MNTLYRVTDAAPSLVCGRHVRPGDEMCLPERVAAYERDLGHLETVEAAVEGAPSGDPEPIPAEPVTDEA